MNKQEFLKFFEQTTSDMVTLQRRKNSDYTGNSDNPFQNLELIESFGVVDARRGVFVRMTDKMARIASFLQKGKYEVQDESFEDTCKDLAVYSILMLGLHKKQRAAAEPTIESTRELQLERAVAMLAQQVAELKHTMNERATSKPVYGFTGENVGSLADQAIKDVIREEDARVVKDLTNAPKTRRRPKGKARSKRPSAAKKKRAS